MKVILISTGWPPRYLLAFIGKDAEMNKVKYKIYLTGACLFIEEGS
jgi:hypothetical protein